MKSLNTAVTVDSFNGAAAMFGDDVAKNLMLDLNVL
jgi:hypothetical protein